MTNKFSNTTGTSTIDTEVSRTWITIEFSLLLIGQILSAPCYLFAMYHILVHKTTRRALNNHVIVLLLFYGFIDLTIDLTLTIIYSLIEFVSPFSPFICLVWQFVDYGIWYGSISLMFWASVERHILVFHPNLICTPRRRLIIHYIPLTFFSLYTPLLYFYLIFIYPCNQIFIYTNIRCGSICYLTVAPVWFIYYDTLAHYTIPILLIAILSGVLILRFLSEKSRLKQATRWRQCRKMIIQLTLVSVSYVVFDLPYIIIVIVQSSGYPDFGSQILTPYISHMVYVPPIIVPYAILLSLPRLKRKLRALLFWRRIRRIVAPLRVMQ